MGTEGTEASSDDRLAHGAAIRTELDRVGVAVSMVILVFSSLPTMGSSSSKMGSRTD